MGDLFKKVMENPELLSGAMSMASALASSGALNGLLGKKTGEEMKESGGPENPQNLPQTDQPSMADLSGMAGLSGLSGLMNALSGNPGRKEPPSPTPPSAPPRKDSPARGMHKERIALLEAMRPFISPEKKDRLELLIRLLGVMEIAEGMGISK